MNATPLNEKVIRRLQDLARQAGGVEPLSRKLDLPQATLKRAIAGRGVTRGTRALIEAGIRGRGG